MRRHWLLVTLLMAFFAVGLMTATNCSDEKATGDFTSQGDFDAGDDQDVLGELDEEIFEITGEFDDDEAELSDDESPEADAQDVEEQSSESEELSDEEEAEDDDSCPEMWEGPAPPDCLRYDCELLPWPDCWDCTLLPDLFQEGRSCTCTGDDAICLCGQGECLPQTGGDEDETEVEIDENETISDPSAIDSMVLAGDSWSSGFIPSVQTLLAETGHTDVEFRYENTTLPGSRASEWAENEDEKLTMLAEALDRPPVAEVLLLVIGGNDINFEIVSNNFDERPEWWRNIVLDGIRDDIQDIVEFAQQGRPHLHVVLIGYDYIHYEFLKAAFGLGDWSTKPYNQTFVALGERKLDLANTTENVHYAHNYGILQWTFGDTVHPPFLLPPIAYDPHVVPKPGTSPDYNPMPGGTWEVPGPLGYLPDGIHPNTEGFYTIMEHSFSQGVLNLIEGDPWP